MSPQTYAMKTLTDGNRKKVRSPSLLVAENVLMPNRCSEAAVLNPKPSLCESDISFLGAHCQQ